MKSTCFYFIAIILLCVSLQSIAQYEGINIVYDDDLKGFQPVQVVWQDTTPITWKFANGDPYKKVEIINLDIVAEKNILLFGIGKQKDVIKLKAQNFYPKDTNVRVIFTRNGIINESNTLWESTQTWTLPAWTITAGPGEVDIQFAAPVPFEIDNHGNPQPQPFIYEDEGNQEIWMEVVNENCERIEDGNHLNQVQKLSFNVSHSRRTKIGYGVIANQNTLSTTSDLLRMLGKKADSSYHLQLGVWPICPMNLSHYLFGVWREDFIFQNFNSWEHYVKDFLYDDWLANFKIENTRENGTLIADFDRYVLFVTRPNALDWTPGPNGIAARIKNKSGSIIKDEPYAWIMLNSSGKITDPYQPACVVHELGHTFKREDQYPNGPSASGGYWVDSCEWKDAEYNKPPNYDKYKCMMDCGYFVTNKWRTWENYWEFKEDYIGNWNIYFNNTEKSELKFQQNVLAIRGFRDGDDISFSLFYRYDAGFVDLEPGSIETYSIELLDVNNNVIQNYGFDCEVIIYADSSGMEELDYFHFDYKVPFSDDIKRIVLKKDNVIKDEVIVSENPPTISFISPLNIQLPYGQETIIDWEGSDPDGQLLYYTVFTITNDDTSNIMRICYDGDEQSNSDYLFMSERYEPDDTVYLKVVATDGVHTARSDTLTVTFTESGVFQLNAYTIAHSCFPNPSSNVVMIQFEIESPSDILIQIYNQLGQQIDIIDKHFDKGGTQELIWNVESVQPGVYYYKITAGKKTANGKMVVVR